MHCDKKSKPSPVSNNEGTVAALIRVRYAYGLLSEQSACHSTRKAGGRAKAGVFVSHATGRFHRRGCAIVSSEIDPLAPPVKGRENRIFTASLCLAGLCRAFFGAGGSGV